MDFSLFKHQFFKIENYYIKEGYCKNMNSIPESAYESYCDSCGQPKMRMTEMKLPGKCLFIMLNRVRER